MPGWWSARAPRRRGSGHRPPVEGIAIIAGVDKLFDMGRTALNITGDATCALWISKLERSKKAKKVAAK